MSRSGSDAPGGKLRTQLYQPVGHTGLDRDVRGNGTAAGTQGTSIWRKVGIVALSTLKWIGLGLLALLVAALVAISVIWGPTHLYVSLPLAVLWVCAIALLVIGPRFYEGWRAQLAAALSLFAVGLLTVLASQLSAYTPQIVDAQGTQVPGSIASLKP